MKRFSVVYTLNKQHYQIYCATLDEAKAVMQKITEKKDRVPIGIYDAKTELFSWEPKRQDKYDHADIEEQGRLGGQIISIAQALRYRDSEWQRAGSLNRLSFFS